MLRYSKQSSGGCLPLSRGYIHVYSISENHDHRMIGLSNIFFSETVWPIKAKFRVGPPWEVGKKVYINGAGHITKMAAMLIYGKNLQKSSPTELIVL